MSAAEDTLDPVSRVRAFWGNPQFRYPVLMIAYLLGLGAAFNALHPEMLDFFEVLEEFTAVCVHRFLGVFTDLTTQRGHLVSLDGFSVLVIMECVGVLEMLIYSSCVLAFPAPLRAKLWGIPLGCGAIFIFNVSRIAMLLVVGRFWSESFDFFHIYFWQATLIAMIVAVLYGWIKVFVHR